MSKGTTVDLTKTDATDISGNDLFESVNVSDSNSMHGILIIQMDSTSLAGTPKYKIYQSLDGLTFDTVKDPDQVDIEISPSGNTHIATVKDLFCGFVKLTGTANASAGTIDTVQIKLI